MKFITISGRIGKDAETRDAAGNQVTSFNMAVDQGYGDKKQSHWFRVSVWGKKGAGAAPYLLKGGVVTVVGELEFGEYNGEVQYNVRASDFTLPAKGTGGNQRSEPQREDRSNYTGRGDRGGGPGFSAYDDIDTPF